MVNLMTGNELRICASETELFKFAAEDFSQRAIESVNKNDFFTVALSGGSTPKGFFDMLASTPQYQSNIPWDKIKFFFGDERYVPATSAESNYHMTDEHLFSKVPVQKTNIFRVPTELAEPHVAAIEYEQMLQKVFAQEIPKFDVIYLGLGDNAHTASLMPDSDIVKQYANTANSEFPLVVSLYVPELKMNRITFTPTIINHAQQIIFLVAGANKAVPLQQVLEGDYNPVQLPAQLIHQSHGKTLWYLDMLAASKLK